MLKNQWSKKEIEDSEYEIHHRALSEEYSFFEAVKDGNIEAVSKNLKEEAFTNPEGMGILSKNPLTNLKYHFVITVALVTRYCIEDVYKRQGPALQTVYPPLKPLRPSDDSGGWIFRHLYIRQLPQPELHCALFLLWQFRGV